ncbi:integrase catalytic domain-containing protein [Trichonephila clavipes]|nr:integrase catalytic domain-containing protein [Trichonephila clavipes]
MQSLIRERFWIIRARKPIKSILNECFVCARFKVKSLSSGPSPLPPDRVNDCAIFEVVGIDLAGSPFLKTGEKVWITLFTCAVYRALHLELVNALSSDAFLLALRRFIARRGRPRIIYCDYGTNFRGAFNDLAKLDWHKISRETSTQKIVWKFIPPTAAWWGGWWERLVRIIKELLRRSLGKSISVKNCVFGHVITKAAVLRDSLDQEKYLLGNKTAALFEEMKKNKEIQVYMVNAVETRSQKKLTEESKQDLNMSEETIPESNEKNKESPDELDDILPLIQPEISESNLIKLSQRFCKGTNEQC